MRLGSRLAAALAITCASGGVAPGQTTVIVPDDFPTIQAAIDSGAGDVLVRPGTYAESVSIVIVNERVISVAGLGGRPTITPPAEKNAFRMRGPGSNARVTLTGLDIVGGRYAVFSDGLVLSDIEDVTVTGSTLGIQIKGEAFVANTTINGTTGGPGFRVTSTFGPFVRNCTARDNSGSGFILKAKGRPGNYGTTYVLDNVAADNGGDGIVFSNAYGPSSVDGNSASGNSHAGIRIKARPVFGVPVTGNTSNDNGRYGFWLHRDEMYSTPQDVIDDGNTAAGNLLGDFYLH